MGVYEGRGQLNKALKDLLNRWIETKSSWDDIRRRQFEETYLIPLEADVRNAVSAMDHMAAILSQIRRDCQ